MHETLVSTVFRDAVKAHPACASLVDVLQWRIPESKDAVVLPAVTFSARDLVPIGKGYFIGDLEARLESHSDDEATSETHIARTNLIAAALADKEPATSISRTINSEDPPRIRLKGYAETGGGRGVDGQRWVATMTLRLCFKLAP